MKEKNNIGLVTYYKENYGSVLQCYATKKFVEDMGYNCTLLYEREKGYLYCVFQRLNNIGKHIWRSFCYKGYFFHYFSMRKAMKSEKEYITKEAKEKLQDFVKNNLKPEGYTWKELCGLNKTYGAFIAGSDQIWNASISIDKIYFLKFADRKKRIALAPSFGVEEIPKYSRNMIKKGLLDFDTVSVREETGVKIVKHYSGKEAIRIADPVLLLNKEEWIKFSEKVNIPNEKYIFVHFLNKPCKIALEGVKWLKQEKQYKIICFSYQYEEYEKFSDYIIWNGNPVEYVGLIYGAQMVCTDSFHTTLFSMIFQKKFYVFHRQYIHECPQTSRISDLLIRYGEEKRLINDIGQLIAIFSKDVSTDEIIEKERNVLIEFLKEQIKEKV